MGFYNLTLVRVAVGILFLSNRLISYLRVRSMLAKIKSYTAVMPRCRGLKIPVSASILSLATSKISALRIHWFWEVRFRSHALLDEKAADSRSADTGSSAAGTSDCNGPRNLAGSAVRNHRAFGRKGSLVPFDNGRLMRIPFYAPWRWRACH